MRIPIALALVAFLCAFGSCDRTLRPDPPPKIVHVPIHVPVSLCPEGGSDCALLRDCYDEDAKEQTYNEAKRLANLRHASIQDDCNKRWAKVREMQPAAKP